MASHSKEVAVVAESIRCLGQETEQYKVCSPELTPKVYTPYLRRCRVPQFLNQ